MQPSNREKEAVLAWGSVIFEEERVLLFGGVEEVAVEVKMNDQGTNDFVGGSGTHRNVHSDDHLAVEVPDTAHQISSGFSSFPFNSIS